MDGWMDGLVVPKDGFEPDGFEQDGYEKDGQIRRILVGVLGGLPSGQYGYLPTKRRTRISVPMRDLGVLDGGEERETGTCETVIAVSEANKLN